MKTVNKRLNKAQIATICLLIISIVLTATYFVISGIAKKRAADKASAATPPAQLNIKTELGESSYLNRPIAYPRIQESQMILIEITKNGEGYGVSRYPDDNSSFVFHTFKDGDENRYPFLPPISSVEGDFNYETLYAVEQNDGFGRIPNLTYLCSALGTPYFTERIELPEKGTDQYNAMLKEYGLTKSESTQIVFAYGDRDPKTNEIIEDTKDSCVITVGGKAVSGSGYYFMVSDGKHERNCVYYTASEYFTYALGGFASFVNGRLVAEGLSNDKGFSPYLTTDFKSWTGTLFDEKGKDAVDGSKNPTVVVIGDAYSTNQMPADKADGYLGYDIEKDAVLTFDLEALKEHPEYEKIKHVLNGKIVGAQQEKIILTLLGGLHGTSSKYVNFTESTYTYTISKIEAVVTSQGDVIGGVTDASHKQFKVTYTYTGGGKQSYHDCHAVIDIRKLPSEDQDKFLSLPIGEELASPIVISVNYTRDNALKSNEKYYLHKVYAVFDEKGATTDVITEKSYINYAYFVSVDGSIKLADLEKKDIKTDIIRLCDIKEDDPLYPMVGLLLGKKAEDFSKIENEAIYNKDYYYEYMKEFSCYEITDIEYFIENEIIVSFEFVNASERDPFYGDIFYKNTLENEYAMYGLNAGTCEKAVELLGGVGAQGSNSTGLTGQTVAVGLTPENMYKYGLFAHRVYFEMPRGLYDKTEMDSPETGDDLSDFGWLRSIGFTLYISDVNYDENGNKFRYIGSDMYDIVAKVYSSDFDFVEYGFVEFWARRNMVMMDVKKLQELKLELHMDDLHGEYTFGVTYTLNESTKETYQDVIASVGAGSFETELSKLLNSEGYGSISLSKLYNNTMGSLYYPGSNQTYGAAYFNSVYHTLQLTAYLDCFEEGEVKRPGEAGFNSPKIMSMRLKVEGADYYYTYDYYRVDARRVMVALYRTDADGNKNTELGEVSDFYITWGAFQKLVNNYITLLNGQPIDKSIGYTD